MSDLEAFAGLVSLDHQHSDRVMAAGRRVAVLVTPKRPSGNG